MDALEADVNVSTLAGRRILVASMTTWGEKGNWLSGAGLAATLRSRCPEGAVELVPAEELVPELAAVGKAIKSVTLESRGTRERFERYAGVLEGLEGSFPFGFEDEPGLHEGMAEKLARLVDYLKKFQPDVVIGTKGLICRLLLAAGRLAGRPRPVVNYVTNHGHFRFPVHRCPSAAIHLVRLPEGRPYLHETCGWALESIRVIGYLVAAQQLQRLDRPSEPVSEAGHGTGRAVIVVSNRGGEEYLDVLRRLLPYRDTIDVTFVALMDEPLGEAAREIVAQAGITSWRVAVHLTQEELFGLMERARARGTCLLVCKASPNSIFEAAYFGLPMFLVRTGLPMEEWGADLVVQEGVGWVADGIIDLLPQLEACLTDPRASAPVTACQRQFVAKYLDQSAAMHNLEGAIAAVLADASRTQPREA
jgi:UDP-N-acetylglucosamine:LPS N-acetylglucosamine transferase